MKPQKSLKILKILKCKECNDEVCICSDEGPDGIEMYSAYCSSCDNSISTKGVFDPVAESEDEAIKLWNKLNETK